MAWSNYIKGVPVRIQKMLGLDIESDEIDQISSGYNYRTFPRKWIFRDQDGWLWKKVGLTTFSFCTHHGMVPSGIRELKTWIGGDEYLVLTCRVERGTINNQTVLDESYQKDYDGDSVSTVCGRASLTLQKWTIQNGR